MSNLTFGICPRKKPQGACLFLWLGSNQVLALYERALGAKVCAFLSHFAPAQPWAQHRGSVNGVSINGMASRLSSWIDRLMKSTDGQLRHTSNLQSTTLYLKKPPLKLGVWSREKGEQMFRQSGLIRVPGHGLMFCMHQSHYLASETEHWYEVLWRQIYSRVGRTEDLMK